MQVVKYHTADEVLINEYTEKVKLDFNCALRYNFHNSMINITVKLSFSGLEFYNLFGD